MRREDVKELHYITPIANVRSRDDLAYVLDGFPIVRRNEERTFGEFRTKRLCLEAHDRCVRVEESPHRDTDLLYGSRQEAFSG